MTDDDQQVWVTVESSQVYHTNRDCDRIKGGANGTWSKAEAETWGKEECSHCSGDIGGKFGDRTTHDTLDKMDPGDLAPTDHDREAADD